MVAEHVEVDAFDARGEPVGGGTPLARGAEIDDAPDPEPHERLAVYRGDSAERCRPEQETLSYGASCDGKPTEGAQVRHGYERDAAIECFCHTPRLPLCWLPMCRLPLWKIARIVGRCR
ncbi:hypothetical protein GCM10010471_11240 [Leucobacter komagatae]